MASLPPLRVTPRPPRESFCVTRDLFYINPRDAFGDSGKDLPGYCTGLGRNLTRKNFFVALPADKHYLFACFDMVQVAGVDHDLIHRDSA